jgi:hypothetical protein
VTFRAKRIDVATVCGYLTAALYLTSGLWIDPAHRLLADNSGDHQFFQWVLSADAHLLRSWRDPFATDLINAPRGVNLMANTSVWTAGLALAPVTLTFGSSVSFALLTTVALAGTATAWYSVLSRRLVASRAAAVIGGAACGFAPGVVSHATSHPNLASQFLVPFIVLAVFNLDKPGSSVRRGLTLAALVVAQAFLGEEVLLLTALATGAFVLAYAGLRPDRVRAALPRAALTLAVAAVAALAVLGYPLWVQFAGPQSYRGHTEGFINGFGADLASYPAYPTRSLAGDPVTAARVAPNASEQNAFFGWSLLALVAFVAVRLRQDPRVRALATVGVVFAVCSFGTHFEVNGRNTHVPAPWWLIRRAPLLDTIIPGRLALVVAVVAGLLVALFLDRSTHRGLAAVATVAALLPLVPTPMPTVDAAATPRFFTSGDWRRYAGADSTLLCLPMGARTILAAMRSQDRTGMGFRLVNGYFVGPADGVRGRPAQIGASHGSIWRLFDERADWTNPRPVTDATRAGVLAELRARRVDLVVIADRGPTTSALVSTAEQVMGPGRHVDDVWIWHSSSS